MTHVGVFSYRSAAAACLWDGGAQVTQGPGVVIRRSLRPVGPIFRWEGPLRRPCAAFSGIVVPSRPDRFFAYRPSPFGESRDECRGGPGGDPHRSGFLRWRPSGCTDMRPCCSCSFPVPGSRRGGRRDSKKSTTMHLTTFGVAVMAVVFVARHARHIDARHRRYNCWLDVPFRQDISSRNVGTCRTSTQ